MSGDSVVRFRRPDAGEDPLTALLREGAQRLIQQAVEAELCELAEAVTRGTEACGFEPEERPFRAHLTLGRIKQGRGPATGGLAAPEGTVSPVRDVILFRSELEPSGAKHTPVERMALGGSVHP